MELNYLKLNASHLNYWKIKDVSKNLTLGILTFTYFHMQQLPSYALFFTCIYFINIERLQP